MTTVAEIEVMDRPQLAALWLDVFGAPPPKSLSRPFLRRTLAFEVQARAMGGLPKGFMSKLERAAGEDAPKRSPGLQPGGRLLRVNERSKLTRFQRLNLTHLLWRKAPSRAALV